jgi:hypothetical protein
MQDQSSTPRPRWPAGHTIPQRYLSERYQQQGGLVQVADDAAAFAGNKPLEDVARFMFLSLAFDQIHNEGLEGDFAELGVYQGSTAAVLARHARRLNRRLSLMDTYEGFDQKDLRNGMDAGRRAAFNDTSLEAVRQRVGEQNTFYIKGYFPDTAAQLPDDTRYCLVHLDADLFGPIMSGLQYFYSRVVPGGFLIIHDYGSLCWPGAETAVDTFFSDKPESVIPIPDSAGSAVIRRARSAGSDLTWIAKQRSLAYDVWHPAGNNQLIRILTDGWSMPEPWGVWGVGPSHLLTLNVSSAAQLIVDLDVHAFVWDASTGREVDFLVDGRHVTKRTFSSAKDHVTISLSVAPTTDSNAVVTIELRPRLAATPARTVPGSTDTRPLGVALHRLRVRSS